ncbi:antiterminator Q family protein [Proteus mirabilis]
MQKISKLMEAWDSWVVNNNLYINTLTINKRENVPIRVKLRKACTDRQGIIVSVCMSKLLKNHKKDYELLVDYYVFGQTFIQLAQAHRCSDTYIGKKLKKAEGIVEGMLIMAELIFIIEKNENSTLRS